MRAFLLLFFLFQLSACTRPLNLNMRPHRWGMNPSRIIWIQIAGLTEEHLAMLRFTRPSAQDILNFERASCIGKTWSYNLTDLRPPVSSGFLTQLTGSKNIKNNCTDYQLPPIWDFLRNQGYKIGIFETGVSPDVSFLKGADCSAEKAKFTQNTYVWSMSAPPNDYKELLTFHAQDTEPFKNYGTYFDKSCLTKNCYSSIFSNVTSVLERFEEKNLPYFLLVRDTSYLNALTKKQITQAQDILQEFEKLLGYFYSMTLDNSNLLVVVTSTGALNIEFPKAGSDWAKFEKSGEGLLYRNTALVAPVFSFGASAENFCGLFEERLLYERFLL